MKKEVEKNVKSMPLFLAIAIIVVFTIIIQQIVLVNITRAEEKKEETSINTIKNMNTNQLVINVKDYGAVGNRGHDDTDAIQRAIDATKERVVSPNDQDPVTPIGGIVYLPAGTYRITKTLILPAFVQLCGENPQTTTIFLHNGADCTMIETENFNNFMWDENGKEDKTKRWYDLSKVPQGFGIKNLTLFGNKYNNTKGNGLSIYGYGFTIDNVWVDSVAEDGVYVDWKDIHKDPTDGFNKVISQFFEASVRDLNIKYCGKIGLNWNNLTDAYLDNITVSECEGETGFLINAPIYLNYAHVYKCYGESNVKITENAHIMKLVSESAVKTALDIKSYYVNIDSLQLYYNEGTDIIIREGSNYTVLDNVELRLGKNKDKSETDKNGIVCESGDVSINSLLCIGEKDTKYTKDPVWLNNKCNCFTLNNAKFKDILGTYTAALSCGNAGQFYGNNINATFFNCDTAFSVGEGCAGTSNINLMVNRTTKQKSLAKDFSPEITVNASINERINGKRNNKLK